MPTPDTLPCHSCITPGHDEHGNPCPRCHGTCERDAREAAAHLAMLNARKVEAEARDAVRRAPEEKRYALGRHVEVAIANVRRARDVWEDELARVADEKRTQAEAVKAKKVAA